MDEKKERSIVIDPSYKYSFLSTVIFGIFSLVLGLFNKYSNHDDLMYFFTGGATFTSGRWMLYWIERLEKMLNGNGLFSLPVINGGLTILCIAFVLCLLVNLFELKSLAVIAALGGILVSIPVVTCMFGYMFTSHFFGISLLFAVSGAWLILKKEKWFYIASGIILMILSVGIYQAYIPTILCVFLFGLIKQTYESVTREMRLELYKKTGIVILSIFLFFAAYIGLMLFFLERYGLQLSSYRGMDSAVNVTFNEYLQRILFAYKEFFAIPSGSAYYDINLRPGIIQPLYLILLVVFMCFYALLIYSHRKKISSLFLFILLLLVPAAVNFIFIMSDPETSYAMMLYGKAVFFVFWAWIFEQGMRMLRPGVSHIVKNIAIVILFVIVFVYARFDNVCYLRMDLIQTQAIRYFTSLVTRIQSTEGYNSFQYVSYINSPKPDFTDNSINEISEFENIRIPPYFDFLHTVGDSVWREYLRLWCGFSPHEIDQAYFENIPEVKQMPHYPDEGSIKIIDETVVVKF